MSPRFYNLVFLAGLACVVACKPPSKASWHPLQDDDVSRVATVISQEGKFLKVVDPNILSRHIVELSRNYHMDPFLILALIRVESNFNAQAHSSAGALGLMQIMPCTLRAIGPEIAMTKVHELLDPLKNIHLGVHYLTFLWNHYHQDLPHTLAAYNVGPGRVDQLIARRTPAPIARGFCQKVMGFYNRYKADALLVAANSTLPRAHF